MLPDYPVAKQKLSRLMHIRMQVRQTQPVIERKGIRTVHEGDRFSTTDIHGNITLQPFERLPH